MKFLVLIFLIISIAVVMFLFQDGNNIDYKKVIAKERNFQLKISNYGTLEASKFVQIKSRIMGQVKLIYLIEEGTLVKKGDVIARFDITALMDKMNDLKFKINQAEAILSKNKKELEVFKRESRDDIEKIKKSIKIAKLNLTDEEKGSGKVKEIEFKQNIIKEKRKLELIKGKLIDFDSLYKKGYISKRERDTVEDEFKNTQESLHILENKLQNYIKYEWKKSISEKEIKLKELIEQLESKKIQNSFELENKKIQVNKARNSLEYYKKRLAKVKIDIECCDVLAPIDGIVLYKKISRAGKKYRAIEIGDTVWQSQAFMQIPDTDKMIVKTYIREVDLSKVKIGMGVEVYLDAYPDKILYGTITYIDSIASNRDDNIKQFKTIITIKNSEKFLRSGMSARVDIVYDELNNTLSIPIEALQFNQENYFVYIDNKKDGEKREIEIGKMGQDYIEVKRGLNSNEVLIIR